MYESMRDFFFFLNMMLPYRSFRYGGTVTMDKKLLLKL